MPEGAAQRPRPGSPGEIFLAFATLSLQSFGGALALIERTMVQRKRWLSAQEFVGLFAISQALPGPSGIAFCVLLGDRYFGLRGAAAALLGFLLLPTIVVLSLAALFQHFHELPQMQGALHGMGAASLGLVVHTAARMARTLRGQWLGIGVAVLAFGAVALLRLPVSSVMASLGLASVLLAWRRLAR